MFVESLTNYKKCNLIDQIIKKCQTLKEVWVEIFVKNYLMLHWLLLCLEQLYQFTYEHIFKSKWKKTGKLF